MAFTALGSNGQNSSAMGGVMAAIAEALVATGVGLFVALPAVVAYNVIQKRIGEIETESLALTKLISAYLKAGRGLPAEATDSKAVIKVEKPLGDELVESTSRVEAAGAV